jgi:hypothetical protein
VNAEINIIELNSTSSGEQSTKGPLWAISVQTFTVVYMISIERRVVIK